MSTTELIKKLETLPDAERAQIETMVNARLDRLTSRPNTRFSRETLDRIDALRESVFKEHGLLPDSTEAIRRERDNS